MQAHELKTDAIVFDDVQGGKKNFEIRKNDRGFQVGDLLVLRRDPESPGRAESRNVQLARVTYILRGGQYGIEEGYVAMGIERVKIEVTR